MKFSDWNVKKISARTSRSHHLFGKIPIIFMITKRAENVPFLDLNLKNKLARASARIVYWDTLLVLTVLNISSFQIAISNYFSSRFALESIVYLSCSCGYKKSLECLIFRSEYQKILARASRSHHFFSQISILFIHDLKKSA